MKNNIPEQEILFELADLFKVFGDSTRLRIMHTLFDSECSVGEIADTLNMEHSTISHQLRVLRTNKLVKLSLLVYKYKKLSVLSSQWSVQRNLNIVGAFLPPNRGIEGVWATAVQLRLRPSRGNIFRRDFLSPKAKILRLPITVLPLAKL